MNKLPVLKIYDIDYSFIIKNYLNPEMWKKTWTLFQYKTFTVTMVLSSIDCIDEKISFKVKVKDSNESRKYNYDYMENFDKDSYNYANYSLKVNNIKLLKKEINNKILSAIENLETQAIKGEDKYINLKYSYADEKDILRKIAEDFLDDNNVTNEDIREVYIDAYIDNNTKLEGYLDDLRDELKYTILPDLYLVFAKATEDEEIIKKIEKRISEVNDIEEINQEIEEYLKYMETEEFQEEKYDELEEI